MSIYKEPIEWVTLAVESILKQSFSDFELLILSDNPENKAGIALIKQYALKDSRIKFFENKKNIGLANTLNKGIELASGKYIARMDADDISHVSRFEKQVAFLNANPNIDLCSTWVKYIDESNKVIRPHRMFSTNALITRAFCYSNQTAHPAWMFRTKVFKTLNGYRDFPASQDYDFLSRLISNGFQAANIKEFLLSYRINPGGISNQRAFIQHTCKKYIRTLYSERTTQNSKLDSFDFHKLELALSDSKKATDFTKSKALFDKGELMKAEKNWLQIFSCYLQAFYYSTLIRRTFLDLISIKCLKLVYSKDLKKVFNESDATTNRP